VKPAKRPRPSLPAISEEMKAWSAALAGEVGGWPQVAPRVFFGLTALYRKDKMFAVLPRTRGMETPNGLAFRLDTHAAALRARLAADPRVAAADMKQARWFRFELSSDADLHDALDWLGRAYDAAGRDKKSR
jgi:hypothetical protein